MQKLQNFLLYLKKQKDNRRNEKIEKLKDDLYDHYYTKYARNHLNRILQSYNRQPQNTYQSSLDSIQNIGLFNPCSDNIKYLKHMRWVSVK
jgi:GH15 family glucan-1,4-alpha-glucosidase